MSRPIQLTIRIDAMRHNLSVIRERASSSRVWAVVKANAYGHGIESAVQGFAQADGLALLDLSEALRARAAGWTKPILMMEGAFSADDLAIMAEHDLWTVISTPEQVEMLARAPRVPKKGWVKLNTGMNRLGLVPALDDPPWQTQLQACATRCSEPFAFMTHFANADTPDGWQAQFTMFDKWQPRICRALGQTRAEVSMANSAATLTLPQTHRDWVRPGIALYGATPFSDDDAQHRAQSFGLRAAQVMESRVIAIQSIARGDAVGYGSRFTAQRDSRIGVVAIGYADGYPRAAANGTPVWVEGRVVPLAGRVSMDMITVDLTDHPTAGVGARVECWGDHVAIDDVAQCAQTVGYELMTKVTARVPKKVVHGEG